MGKPIVHFFYDGTVLIRYRILRLDHAVIRNLVECHV